MKHLKKVHHTVKKVVIHFTKKEVKLFLLAFIVLLTILTSFIPVYESSISRRERKALSLPPQSLFASLLKRRSDSERAFMVKQLTIGQGKIVVTPTPLPVQTVTGEWGKATQIDEHTWTMKLQSDPQMASAQEILSALNAYRQKKGKGSLSWDGTLANYAQERANFFVSNGKLDGHAGFQSYMNNDGFSKLGFSSLGENSSYGYMLEGVHLIEWVYAGDAPHDNNQLNSDWSHVGIGVSGTATDLIFGGQKR